MRSWGLTRKSDAAKVQKQAGGMKVGWVHVFVIDSPFSDDRICIGSGTCTMQASQWPCLYQIQVKQARKIDICLSSGTCMRGRS